MDVTLEGDAEIGDIIADNEDGSVNIEAGGSITQEEGTAIRGEDLKVEADGDVKLDVFVDNAEIDAGGDVDLSSGKSQLEVEIDAGGDVEIDGPGDLVSNGGVNINAGGDVTVDMGGNIGSIDQDFVIETNGDVEWNTNYGVDFVTVQRIPGQIKLWDDPDHREYYTRKADGNLELHQRPGTALEVWGYGLEDAFLWVGTEQLRKSLFAQAQNQIKLKITVNGKVVFDYVVAIDRVIEKILTDNELVPVIDWDAEGKYAGKNVTFRYFVGSEYNGSRYTVSIERGGEVTEMTGTVENGYIEFGMINAAATITVNLNSEA